MKKTTLKKQFARDEKAAEKAVKCEVKKFRHRMAAILSGLLVAAQVFAGTIAADPNSSFFTKLPDTKEMISLINKDRKNSSLPILAEDTLLDKAAQNKLADMQAKHYWDHVSPDGRQPWDFINAVGYDYAYAGENLAKGFVNADAVVTAWMNSPKHRENLLSPNYTGIGIASGIATIDSQPTTITVEMFGKPKPVESTTTGIFAKPVLGASTEANVSLTTPVSDNRILYFILWSILFSIIVYDGIELRRCGLHKSKKHMFEFRTALLINCLAFLLLFVNIAAIS